MAICIFLGHPEVLDHHIYRKLCSAVDQIVAENEHTEFFLYSTQKPFYDFCFLAALRAKQRHPEKVSLTLLINRENYPSYLQQDWFETPVSLYDKVLPVSIPKPKSTNLERERKAAFQKLVGEADYIICAVYDAIVDSAYEFYKALKIRPDQHIVDLSDARTKQLLDEGIQTLSEREQAVEQGVLEGLRQSEIAKRIGLSRTRTRQIIWEIGRDLKKYVRAKNCASEDPAEKPWSCGIFCTGPATYQALKRFDHYIRFLRKRYGVTVFYVEQEFLISGFAYVLHQKIETEEQVIVVTPNSSEGQESPGENVDSIPYHAVTAIPGSGGEDDWDVIKCMMEKSVFCICDFSCVKDMERVQKYLPRTRNAVLLDLGGKQFVEEGP